MKSKNNILHHLGFIALAFASNTAHATSINWTGATTGLWSATGNWSTLTVPTSSDDLTILGPSNVAGALTINLDIDSSANSINFTDTAAVSLTNTTSASDRTLTLGTGGLTIGTGTVAIGSGTTNQKINIALSGSQTWNVGSGGLTATNVISGTSFGITKTGTGTLTLSGVNIYTGGTTVSAGILRIQTGGAAATGGFSLGGGTLQISQTANNFGYNPTINLTADSTISNFGTGAINTTGTINGNNHVLNASSGATRLYLNGTHNNITQINITAGAVGLDLASAGHESTPVVVSSGASLFIANATNTLTSTITLNGGTGFGGTGALALEGGVNLTPILSGTLTLNSGNSSIGNAGTANAGNNISVTGLVTGTGSLTKISINKLSLSNAASDYSGTTTVSAGTLNASTFANVNTVSSIGKGSAGGSSADFVLNGGTLQYTGATPQSTDRLFSVGTSNGTLDASGSNTANSLSFTGTGAMGFNSQTGTRTLTLTGTNTGSNRLALAIGDNTGATSVTKTGAGTWALGGTNTYSGATTVTTGALSFLNLAAKSASTTVTAAAGTTIGLGVGGAGFYSSADVNSLLANTLSGFSLDAATLVGIDTTAGDVTFDTTGLSGTRTLAKLGTNTLNFSGTNTYAGATQVQNGTLEFQSATAISSTSALTIGNGGTLSLRADADTTFTPANSTGAGSYTIAVNQLTGAGAGKTLTLANAFTIGTANSGNNLTVSSTSGDTLLLSSQLNLANNGNGASSTITLSGANMTLNAGVNYNGNANGPTLNVNAGSNTLLINGNYTTGNNRWSGIVINNGTVTMANGQNGGSSTNNGVYAVLNGGTLNLNNNNAIGGVGGGNGFTINGGTLDNTSGSAKTLSKNPVTNINANFAFSTSGGTSANDLSLGTNTVSLGTAAGTARTITTNGTATLTIGGIISNGTTANGLTKAGTGTLFLTGTNTYTGDTTVTAGVLAVDGDAVPNAGKLVIDGGQVDPKGFTELVGSLYFGATQQASGTYSAVAGPGVDFVDTTHFTGTGAVSVTTGPSGYSTWATTNVGGQTPSEDYNNDGVGNGIAYFMNNTGVISLPGLVGGAVTWTNGGNIPTSAYGTQYRVQTSPDLVNWTPVVSGDLTTNTAGPGGSLTYTLPTGQGKFFVRLTVTPQ